MAKNILMPALTPTMEVGTLSQWLVEPGDSVVAGQVIAEIETDKSVLEFEALHDGVIGDLLVADGAEDVKVDTVIATLLEAGEPPATAGDPESTEPPPAPEPATAVESISGLAQAVTQAADRVRSSPAARRIAKESGIDIADVKGTGPRGRILANDVRAAREVAKVRAAGGTAGPIDIEPDQEIKLSTLQKTMAARMTEAKTTIPHLYCSIDVNIDRLIRLRQSVNESDAGVRTTLNDYVVRAAAMALRANAQMNVQFRDNRLFQFKHADVSVAMAVENGLVTPIVRSADMKSVLDIASEVKMLAAKAQERKLLPEEYDGGTFTISNVGMFGLTQSWPIINPPQAGILGVGAAAPRPVVVDGEIKIASIMTLTLSADHRVVDGAIAGEFLAAIRRFLERPAQLLL